MDPQNIFKKNFLTHVGTMARWHGTHETHNGIRPTEFSTSTFPQYVMRNSNDAVSFQWTVSLRCPSYLRANRYSCLYLSHKPSLHRLIYLCRFFIVSLSFSWGAAKNVLHVHGSNYLEPKLDSQFLLPYRLLTYLVKLLTQPMSIVVSQWSCTNLLYLGQLVV